MLKPRLLKETDAANPAKPEEPLEQQGYPQRSRRNKRFHAKEIPVLPPSKREPGRNGSTASEERQLMLRLEELAEFQGLRRNERVRMKLTKEKRDLLHSKAADSEVLKHDGTVSLSRDWDIGDGRKINADEIAARDIDGLKLSDSAGNGIFVEDGGNVGIGTASPGGLLGLSDSNTYLNVDGNGNLTITDANAGTRTLKNLGCPTYVAIKATGQSEGDLHLSDATNWGVSKALIKLIRIVTNSTDWDLYLLQNDNGRATNDANIPEIQIMSSGNGNMDIYLDTPYEDEDASDEVHISLVDNSGSNTADIYIIGYEMV